MAFGDHIPYLGARAEHGERSLLARMIQVRREIPQEAVRYALLHRQDHTEAAMPQTGQVIDLDTYRRDAQARLGKSAVSPETDDTINLHDDVPQDKNDAYTAAIEAVDRALKESA